MELGSLIYSTWYSITITHQHNDKAQRCLAAVIVLELVPERKVAVNLSSSFDKQQQKEENKKRRTRRITEISCN